MGFRGVGATKEEAFEQAAIALTAVVTDPLGVTPLEEVDVECEAPDDVLVGTKECEGLSFSSSCHGAGRAMSRHQALKQWKGREMVDYLAGRGIIIRSPSMRGVAEEAPGAYKDVGAVVDAADEAGLSLKVARLER